MPLWLSIPLVIVLLGGTAWLILRSAKRWQTPPAGKSPESQQAEAKLWSKRGFGSRGAP